MTKMKQSWVMSPIRCIQSLALSVVICLMLLVYNTTPAFACTPVPPTPWYSTTLSILATNLPENIHLNVANDRIELENGSRFKIYVKSDTGSLEKITDKNLDMMISPYYYSSGKEALILRGDNYRKNYKYKTIPLQTLNVVADNRPQNTTIPPPEDVNVEIFVGKQPYNVKIRVTYQLNTNYRYDSVFASKNACSSFYLFTQISYFFLNSPTVIIFMIFGVIVMIIMLVISKERKSPKGE